MEDENTSAALATTARTDGAEAAVKRATEKVEILRYFGWGGITQPGPRREIARHYGILAASLIVLAPDSEQRGIALQKLLESRDAALRSAS
jgi:hypothetical protein